MAKMRVHELAKEFGVESKVIISRLFELGEFVKSASSQLPPHVVNRFYHRYGDQLPDRATRSQLPAGLRARIVPDPQPPKAAPRPTSWDDSIFDARARQIWYGHGLGENDARLAQRLLEAGLLPEDLQLRLRGRSAVSRLRGGEEAWPLLFAEMREVRASGDPRPREAPSKAITRRWKAS